MDHGSWPPAQVSWGSIARGRVGPVKIEGICRLAEETFRECIVKVADKSHVSRLPKMSNP